LLKNNKRKIEEEVYKTPIESNQLTEYLRTKGTLAKGEVKATIVN
jgi:hypothetical protein